MVLEQVDIHRKKKDYFPYTYIKKVTLNGA